MKKKTVDKTDISTIICETNLENILYIIKTKEM